MKARFLEALSFLALVLSIGVMWEAIGSAHAVRAQSGQNPCPVGQLSPPAICVGNCTPPLECKRNILTGLCVCG